MILETFNILFPGRNKNDYNTKLKLLLSKYNYDLNKCKIKILIAEYMLC